MVVNRDLLEKTINKGEKKNGEVEFKSELEKDVHLLDGKRQSLVAQMRYRIKSGEGKATYVIGVMDNGDIEGLNPKDFSESMDVLSILADEADAYISEANTWKTDDDEKVVGLAEIRDGKPSDKHEDHLIIGTAGHVDHGKSTIVGSLMTGRKDNGQGETRSYLDVNPHEIERGLSADLSYGLYGFKDGETLEIDNPNRNSDRSALVEEADRIVSFVDTVGHKPWLRTTIRGLVGQKIDYGLLAVAADDGPTDTTREHLGLLIATDLPVIIAITKTDMVSDERVQEVEKDIEKLLREVNQTPILFDRYGVDSVVDEIERNNVVPIVRTSAVTGEGYDKLNELFRKLSPKKNKQNEDCKMYVDKIYNIDGVGPVVSGTVQSGSIETGDEVLIGPMNNGEFKRVTVRSIEIHYYSVDKVKSGQIASLALSDVDYKNLERGMVIMPEDSNPEPTKKFRAELMVLNHPTKITDGYEPVIHLETISETVIIDPDSDQMMPGQKGTAKLEFKFSSNYIQEGQKFVFREGDSKGVGKVKEIIK